MAPQLSAALQKLASFRVQNSRQSLKIVAAGASLLQSSSTRGSDADVFASLEQLALAAVDVGKLDIADVCNHFFLR